MKKLFALLLAMMLVFSLAACGQSGDKDDDKEDQGSKKGGSPAPEFNGTYTYAPPTDNYRVEWTSYDADGTPFDTYIYARIGQGHTMAEVGYGVYHASDDMQIYYERAWDGEYSYWMQSPGYGYTDWKSDNDEDSPDLGSCSAMDEYFMHYFRAYGYDDEKLTEFYVGTETVCGVNCWVFDSKGLNAINAKYWIDPSNGCCLKCMDTEDGTYSMVTKYDLNYTQWTDNLAPDSYEGIQ